MFFGQLDTGEAEVVAVATEGLRTAEETSRVMLYLDLAQAHRIRNDARRAQNSGSSTSPSADHSLTRARSS